MSACDGLSYVHEEGFSARVVSDSEFTQEEPRARSGAHARVGFGREGRPAGKLALSAGSYRPRIHLPLIYWGSERCGCRIFRSARIARSVQGVLAGLESILFTPSSLRATLKP
jgi:hypothetical protein